MAYIYDQVLAPPSDILTDPIDDESFGVGKGVCEAESLQFFFSYLDLTAGIRYRVNKSADFLCLDWVRHRIWDDLEDGRPFPNGENMMDATQYTLQSMTDLLRGWGLFPCDDRDEDRSVLIWVIGNDLQMHVGHIQVRRITEDDDIWESKVARTPWVITHAEFDFQYYKGNLVRSTYFKKARY
ncbi:hypothetical protein FRB95_006839 [Tulasnella sp. JGI-2019a]|nr:hypothetical protein FRB93_007150 [Tulasnella sp. JGI-2019a]KAG9028115.1 hypothetical protein FRB95_006839 [Tulasnella sp. JGI-2019a]